MSAMHWLWLGAIALMLLSLAVLLPPLLAEAPSPASDPDEALRRLYQAQLTELKLERSGGGLSETDQQRLFEPFYTTKPSGAGLGLGLAICRDLAAEFGGDLQAHNHPEGGACFVLTVPVGPAPDTAKDAPSR